MQVRAELEDPLVLADTPFGSRRILYVTRGSFDGPGLHGQVLPGGGDWVLMRPDGVAMLDIRLTLRTDDAHLIYVHADGVFHMSPGVSQRIQRDEDVDPSEYYFRTCPVFETGAEKYAHLTRMLAVGVGMRTATGMVTDIFAVR